MKDVNPKLGPILKALVAALLFGASAPLAKALLEDVAPIPLAALLYLGCGAGALLLALVLRSATTGQAEALLATNDLPHAFEHEHSHDHDDLHHVHRDQHPESASDRHSHPHRHERVAHSHPHTPDIHHRHEHHDE